MQHNYLTHKRSNIMSQAKTLTPAEVDHVLLHLSQHSYALRNRVMFLGDQKPVKFAG